MKISFSNNHDGDLLVLVDGKVKAIAKTCDGYEYLISEANYIKRQKRAYEVKKKVK